MDIKNRVKGQKNISLQDFYAMEFNDLKDEKDRDVSKLVTSIKQDGFIAPAYVWKDHNYVIDGKGREMAMRILEEDGHTMVSVPIIEIEADNLQDAKALALKYSSRYGLISKTSFEVFTEGFDVDWNGIDLEGIDQFSLEKKNEKDDEVPELPEEPTSKLGEVYKLGEHRLMCGSATEIADIEVLLDGKTPDLVHTDPPYGMNAVSKSGVLSANYSGDILGDDNADVAKDSFNLVYGLLPEAKHIWWGANYYCSVLPDSECWLVWDKNNGGSDQTDCELAWANFRSVVRQFTQASEKTNRVHPTQKPVSLMAWIIKRFKLTAKIVFDPFLGSGSTLIAAEKEGIICYGMELDPKYVDVIIQRWEEYTGEEAKLLTA